MRIFPVPFSNVSHERNIADTKGTHAAPLRIRDIYEKWQAHGVSFLSDEFLPAALEFDKLLYREFYGSAQCPRPEVTPIYQSGYIERLATAAYRQRKNQRVAFLGGDHSISYHLFRKFARHYGRENSFLIALDAHPDLMNKGVKAPYHSDWLRFVIGHDGFPAEQVLALGWREPEAEEIEFADSHAGLEIFPMHAIRENGLTSVLHDVVGSIRTAKEACEHPERFAVYVSMDFDVFDPSVAPGVTTQSQFGLSATEAITLVKTLAKMPEVKAVDMVEIDPALDPADRTAKVAIAFLREFSAYS